MTIFSVSLRRKGRLKRSGRKKERMEGRERKRKEGNKGEKKKKREEGSSHLKNFKNSSPMILL